jgi:hypothetical protein
MVYFRVSLKIAKPARKLPIGIKFGWHFLFKSIVEEKKPIASAKLR